MSDILVIDSTQERSDLGFVVHPSQLKWASKFDKESFDGIQIHNTSSDYLTHKSFFHLHRILKKNGQLIVVVNQKISVLQDLDAQEIESNAKLGGFSAIDIENFEKFVKENGKDIRNQSLQLIMTKD